MYGYPNPHTEYRQLAARNRAGLPDGIRERILRPRPCRARCPKAAIRRNARLMACTPSSCRAPRSPRRAGITAVRGCTGFVRRRCTSRSRNLPLGRGSSPTSPRCRRRRRTSCAGIPLPMPDRADRFRRRLGDDGRQRCSRSDERLRDPPVRREPLDEGPLLLQCRRRIADRAAGRPPAYRHRTGPARCRAVRDRGDSARRALRGERCRMARRAATSARTSARCCVCRTSARSARTAWPIRAISSRRTPLTKIAKATFELVAKMNGSLWRADIGHSPLDVVAWHGNYAPYKYDLRRFNTIGSISFDHPDPSIFLVLQSQTRYAGRRHDRLRDFPAALARGRRYVPPALVPSQRRERIHGPRAWRVRREGRRLRAGRREPAQLHVGPRTGRGDVRESVA